jgi:sulfur-oxidizing protein SoxY
MNSSRRSFIRQSAILGALGALHAAGFVNIPQASARDWNTGAFEADSLDEAINRLTGESVRDGAGIIRFVAPPIAENGAVVPVGVRVEDGEEIVSSIAILCEKNPRPLAAFYELHPDAVPFIRTRIKMRETAPVLALVRTESGIYRAEHIVKVTKGGCGG